MSCIQILGPKGEMLNVKERERDTKKKNNSLTKYLPMTLDTPKNTCTLPIWLFLPSSPLNLEKIQPFEFHLSEQAVGYMSMSESLNVPVNQ